MKTSYSFLSLLAFGLVLSSCTLLQTPTQEILPEDLSLTSNNNQQTSGLQQSQSTQEDTMTVTELQVEDLELGTGAEATAGSTIQVHYTGTLTDGTKFDSSLDRGRPFQFVLGVGDVIQGWDQGFEGMNVGGKRKLIIPPTLGYGSRAVGSIPPNSTLIFEVELLGVNP